MTPIRPVRPLLSRAFAAFAVLLAVGAAGAEDAYPTRPVTVVNPWAPGGPSDAIIRPIAQQLGTRLGQQFVVENRAGANGTIGATSVARAKPDGYTLFFAHVAPIAISPSMPQKPPYDPVKDFVPVALLASGPSVLVVRSDFPAKSLAELTDYAKANPGKVTYGSVGVGSNTHLAGAMLENMAKVQMVHVPYKGSATIQTDIVGGQLTTAFVNLGGALGLINEGRLRPLAVTTLKRSSVLPQVPTVAESLPGFEIDGWYGVMAPAGTPPEIVRKLNAEINEVLKTAEIRTRLRDAGMESQTLSTEAFGAKLREELVRWGAAVKAAGIRE